MPPNIPTKLEASEADKPRGMRMSKVEKVYDLTRRRQYRLIEQGVIKSYVIGRTRFIDVDSIENTIAGSQA
jgi:hypothetical protein